MRLNFESLNKIILTEKALKVISATVFIAFIVASIGVMGERIQYHRSNPLHHSGCHHDTGYHFR